jgi:putative transposase
MRFTQQEKMELIQLVENSEIGPTRTLKALGIPKSTFYNWYGRYAKNGYDGLTDRPVASYWNMIPPEYRARVIDIALDRPELSPRELAYHIVDNHGFFVSESSVYRILKKANLIASPAYIVMSASDQFKDKTTYVNEMWQTDFTYFKIINWGWYYLSTILDDYSRYIVHWEVCSTMKTTDVKNTINSALMKAGLKEHQRPRLLSDNGSCYISDEMKLFIKEKKMKHVRGRPRHPQTQGKIERYHRSMKNIIKLEHYYTTGQLEVRMEEFVNYYNNERYHESLQNCTPADVYFGRQESIIKQREKLKRKTMNKRRQFHNLQLLNV